MEYIGPIMVDPDVILVVWQQGTMIQMLQHKHLNGCVTSPLRIRRTYPFHQAPTHLMVHSILNINLNQIIFQIT